MVDEQPCCTDGNVARTDATGRAEMVPELLAWTTSLVHDRSLVREDLLGSAAHVTMLRKVGLLEESDAKQLRGALLGMFDDATVGKLVLDDGEEDVHMAIEARLTRDLGQVGKRLHAARSRNDQVALALRLHVRDQAAKTLGEIANLVSELADRATHERDVILPAYTHRQRAQPISAAFLIVAWANQLLRAADAVAVAVQRATSRRSAAARARAPHFPSIVTSLPSSSSFRASPPMPWTRSVTAISSSIGPGAARACCSR